MRAWKHHHTGTVTRHRAEYYPGGKTESAEVDAFARQPGVTSSGARSADTPRWVAGAATRAASNEAFDIRSAFFLRENLMQKFVTIHHTKSTPFDIRAKNRYSRRRAFFSRWRSSPSDERSRACSCLTTSARARQVARRPTVPLVSSRVARRATTTPCRKWCGGVFRPDASRRVETRPSPPRSRRRGRSPAVVVPGL